MGFLSWFKREESTPIGSTGLTLLYNGKNLSIKFDKNKIPLNGEILNSLSTFENNEVGFSGKYGQAKRKSLELNETNMSYILVNRTYFISINLSNGPTQNSIKYVNYVLEFDLTTKEFKLRNSFEFMIHDLLSIYLNKDESKSKFNLMLLNKQSQNPPQIAMSYEITNNNYDSNLESIQKQLFEKH